MTKHKGIARALGKVAEETLKADLERYRQMALELGASGAAIIPAGDVTVDERVRLKCKEAKPGIARKNVIIITLHDSSSNSISARIQFNS